MESIDFNILINKYSLSFRDKVLEEEFRHNSIEDVKKTIRIAAGLGLFIFTLVSIFNTPDISTQSKLINVFLIPVTGLGLISITFLKNYQTVYLYAIFLLYIVGSISAIYTSIFDPNLTFILYLRIVFFTLVPFVTFRVLILSGITLLTSTVLMNLTLSSNSFEDALKRGMFLVPFFVVSLLAFYIKQKLERLTFIKNKELIDKNILLEFDKQRLENQGVLGVILQDSTDISMDLDEFLQNALEVLLYLPWLKTQSKGSVSLINNKNDLELIAYNNIDESLNTCSSESAELCLCRKALEKKELLFIDSQKVNSEIPSSDIQPLGLFSVPLMLDKDAVLGILNVYVEHGHEKKGEEEEFLLLVANTLASVIYRHKLEQEKHKQTIEIKISHDKIKSSIEYAKRIQESLLPSSVILSDNFEDFIIKFLPKEIVSGDFYLIKKFDETIYVSVADCTGHGVPGALVSTLGIQQLSYIISDSNKSVGQKLDKLNTKISNLLNNDSQIGSDGMDLILLSIDQNQKMISYAGAKGIFYIYKDSELIRLKTDSVSIGQQISDIEFKFNQSQINYSKDDTLFLLSDGIIDQRSIIDNKRIGSKRVKELMVKIAEADSKDKDVLLTSFLNDHILNNQIDDITLMTFKL